MPKVVMQEIDNLHGLLTITLEPADYQAPFNEAMKPYAAKDLRGFRKGKTPMSAIKKQLGRPVLANVINGLLGEELRKFEEESEGKIMTPILVSLDSPKQDLHPVQDREYTFVFDVSLVPPFELKGLDKSTTYVLNVVEPTDEETEENLRKLSESFRARQDIEEGLLEDNDMLTISAKEQEGDFSTELKYLLSKEVLTDTAYEALLGLPILQPTVANIFEMEQDMAEDKVRKQVLGLEEGQTVTPMFELTVTKVSRLMPSEMDQAFFDKAFGPGKVSSVEEAKVLLKQYNIDNAQVAVNDEFFGMLYERLMELNADVQFSEDFLQRVYSEGGQAQAMEDSYDAIMKSTRWGIIQARLMATLGITVTQQDMQQQLSMMARSMLGGMEQSPEIYKMILEYMMKDEQQMLTARHSIEARKIAAAARPLVTIEEVPMSIKAYNEMLEQKQAERNASPRDGDVDEIEEAQIEEATQETEV